MKVLAGAAGAVAWLAFLALLGAMAYDAIEGDEEPWWMASTALVATVLWLVGGLAGAVIALRESRARRPTE